MQFDRKFLLIVPSIVLAFVIAGMIYAALQLRVLTDVGETWKDRADFITSVERGERALTARQAIGVLKLSLEVESRRTTAIAAARDLLYVLAGITAMCWLVLVDGVRRVRREHWPRLSRAG